MTSPVTRRDLLIRLGTGLVAITISSPRGPISPAEARASGMKLRNPSAAEGRTLEVLALDPKRQSGEGKRRRGVNQSMG